MIILFKNHITKTPDETNEEFFNLKKLHEAGVDVDFVQDNHSLTRNVGTIRGLHFQSPPYAQAKFVRCLRGRLLDVFVDIRAGSPTYLNWSSVELSSSSGEAVFIPEGYAHGFVTLEPDTEIFYKVTNFYSQPNDDGLRWNDPQISVEWPHIVDPGLLSEKDLNLPFASDFVSPFKYDGTPMSFRTVYLTSS